MVSYYYRGSANTGKKRIGNLLFRLISEMYEALLAKVIHTTPCQISIEKLFGTTPAKGQGLFGTTPAKGLILTQPSPCFQSRMLRQVTVVPCQHICQQEWKMAVCLEL